MHVNSSCPVINSSQVESDVCCQRPSCLGGVRRLRHWSIWFARDWTRCNWSSFTQDRIESDEISIGGNGQPHLSSWVAFGDQILLISSGCVARLSCSPICSVHLVLLLPPDSSGCACNSSSPTGGLQQLFRWGLSDCESATSPTKRAHPSFRFEKARWPQHLESSLLISLTFRSWCTFPMMLSSRGTIGYCCGSWLLAFGSASLQTKKWSATIWTHKGTWFWTGPQAFPPVWLTMCTHLIPSAGSRSKRENAMLRCRQQCWEKMIQVRPCPMCGSSLNLPGRTMATPLPRSSWMTPILAWPLNPKALFLWMAKRFSSREWPQVRQRSFPSPSKIQIKMCVSWAFTRTKLAIASLILLRPLLSWLWRRRMTFLCRMMSVQLRNSCRRSLKAREAYTDTMWTGPVSQASAKTPQFVIPTGSFVRCFAWWSAMISSTCRVLLLLSS